MPEIDVYLRKIEDELRAGRPTEHSHRPALKALIESLFPRLLATNEPRQIECGAPDLSVTARKDNLIVGFIEAKDIGRSLDEAERSEQLKRYLARLPNLILTDYLEFRWYVDGEFKLKAVLGRLRPNGRIAALPDGPESLLALLRSFVDQGPIKVGRAKELAQRLAGAAHLIREAVVKAFENDAISTTIKSLREILAQTLLPGLEDESRTAEFADMYAQTLAYGLFAARVNHRGAEPFRRQSAAREIPKTNPFLRRLFESLTGTSLDDEPHVIFVDNLVSLLAQADMASILEDFGQAIGRRDPVVHFYETFLAAYDPKLREMRGVYYTPEPVVNFIVNSVDKILKKSFGCPGGLAETGEKPRVFVLDPACGTGSFLYAVVDLIRREFIEQGNLGLWPGYVKNHLLPRLFGFELLMAPYAVAHFKLAMQLAGQDLGSHSTAGLAYDFGDQERLGVYLTNALEGVPPQAGLPFPPWDVVANEAREADRIRKDLPILVVVGNPPYSGHSFNRSWFIDENKKKVQTFIGRLIEDYKFVDGQPLGERNPKWLQDDYVKFLRFGQWRIKETGQGVLAFITNHGYLDNPTFRGMRQSLLKTFSRIYVLDLHGNAKKKEVAPDGSKDENVFDIQQGVAIGIFVKEPGAAGPAQVFHADLWGDRQSKYDHLGEADLEGVTWAELTPQPPFYLFIPQDVRLKAEYERGWPVNQIFPLNSVGVVTARDKLTIGWTREEIWGRVQDFAGLDPEEARQKYDLGDDARDWQVKLAQADVRQSGPSPDFVKPILYRPFDRRFIYYTGRTRGFICMPRPEVMGQMLGYNNLAIITSRLTKGEIYKHCQVTRNIVEVICMSPKTSNNGFVFPLYRNRLPNLHPDFLSALSNALDLAFTPSGPGDLEKTFGPEDVFHYIYAVFHAPSFRARYAEFLKIDFPRVPLTENLGLFRDLVGLGRELVKWHLLEDVPESAATASFPVSGDNLVAKGHPRYLAEGSADPLTGQKLAAGRVYINQSQYFQGVPEEVWSFHVGGYKVAEKWLKDRRGRNLDYAELVHYRQVLPALAQTIRLMAEIDRVIEEAGGWPI